MSIDVHRQRRTISGPFTFLDGAFLIEFFEPELELGACTLWKATWKKHPIMKSGKKMSWVPPLHLHFDQAESFKMLSGSMGLTTGYDLQDHILTPSDPVFRVDPWTPHFPWPDPNTTEDAVFLGWTTPQTTASPLDRIFFEHVFRYMDEIHNTKSFPDPIQLSLMMHETASTNIMFPTATWLGPLRWWIPWKFQAGMAALGRSLGYTPAIEKYLKSQ